MRNSVSVAGGLKGAFAGLLALGFIASPAVAATLNIGTTGATLTCSVSCEGFTGAGGLDIDPPPPDFNDPTGVGTLSALKAQLYNGQPANAGAERTRLETLIGGPAGDLNFESGGDPSSTFTSDAVYLVLKLGPSAIFIKNTSGVVQEYTYALNGARGLGLSHYTTFGEVGEVPLPAAAWLMIAGLAGLGFAGRKKKAAA